MQDWRSLKTLPSRASRAPRSSSCQSIVRRREPRSCGRCSMARRSWPADAKSASKKLSPSTTTGLETAVKAMGANGSDPRKMRHCVHCVELATASAHHRAPAHARLNLASLKTVGRPPVVAPDPARTIRSQKAAQDPSDISNALYIGRS